MERSKFPIAAAVTLMLMAAGCASTPPAPVPNSTATTASTPAPTPTPAPETRKVKLDATNVAEAQYAGYKLVNRNGEKLYCRRDASTGSRVEFHTRCLTEEEMAQQQAVNRRDMERMEQVPQPMSGK